jgi:uncharacterized protein with PQ loop repeat
VTDLTAAAASVIAAILLVPQVWRVVHQQDHRGVSSSWAVLGVAVNAAWVSHFALVGLWPAIAAPFMAVLAYTVLIRRLPAKPVPMASPFLRSVGALAVGISIGLWSGAGVILALAPLVHLTPAVIAVFRVANPSGVSLPTWFLSAVEAGLWGVYGGLVGEASLIGYAVVTVLGSGLISVRCLVTRASGGTVIPSRSSAVVGLES